MPEVIINGPAGRLECRYMPGLTAEAPTALVLHPEPDKGGTMNNRVTFATYKLFQARGFAVMRFNFRGVGKSQGSYEQGEGELSDAATAIDWLRPFLPQMYVGSGFSFGSWVAMQLMMRRPEITGLYRCHHHSDTRFHLLAPCPASGLIIQGQKMKLCPQAGCRRWLIRFPSKRRYN